MRSHAQPRFTAAAVAATVVLIAWSACYNGGFGPSDDENDAGKAWRYEAVPIEDAVGPESFAFDPRGDGPYTGVSDGRIIKWNPTQNRWLNFAVTSSHRWRWRWLVEKERQEIKEGIVLYRRNGLLYCGSVSFPLPLIDMLYHQFPGSTWMGPWPCI